MCWCKILYKDALLGEVLKKKTQLSFQRGNMESISYDNGSLLVDTSRINLPYNEMNVTTETGLCIDLHNHFIDVSKKVLLYE